MLAPVPKVAYPWSILSWYLESVEVGEEALLALHLAADPHGQLPVGLPSDVHQVGQLHRGCLDACTQTQGVLMNHLTT